MTSSERLRRRRCLALWVAIFFGILLPAFDPRWPVLAVAVAGIGLALVTYWRACRRPPPAT